MGNQRHNHRQRETRQEVAEPDRCLTPVHHHGSRSHRVGLLRVGLIIAHADGEGRPGRRGYRRPERFASKAITVMAAGAFTRAHRIATHHGIGGVAEGRGSLMAYMYSIDGATDGAIQDILCPHTQNYKNN